MRNKVISVLMLASFFGLLLTITKCASNVESEDLSTCPTVTKGKALYSVDVYPIIDKTCAIPQCHVNDFEYGNFRMFEEVKKRADNGKLKFMIESRTMPHGFTDGPWFLTICEAETIKLWIEQGAIND